MWQVEIGDKRNKIFSKTMSCWILRIPPMKLIRYLSIICIFVGKPIKKFYTRGHSATTFILIPKKIHLDNWKVNKSSITDEMIENKQKRLILMINSVEIFNDFVSNKKYSLYFWVFSSHNKLIYQWWYSSKKCHTFLLTELSTRVAFSRRVRTLPVHLLKSTLSVSSHQHCNLHMIKKTFFFVWIALFTNHVVNLFFASNLII